MQKNYISLRRFEKNLNDTLEPIKNQYIRKQEKIMYPQKTNVDEYLKAVGMTKKLRDLYQPEKPVPKQEGEITL